ncbi:energy transducer TonB [Hymenobacter sp. BT18]|uniref:energy transducer TonB family protein n=1 Tax=Hymenobacter sp. BT18 TaxID=2835648 RepID=UPI00143E2F8F|nr:energy transducer TonB [Hymenobacter sp. BT18]QIX61539.1 energy transducer TonB [Hymenobacter sp. BT18]
MLARLFFSICLLLFTAQAIYAQNSYNQWEASKPAPVAKPALDRAPTKKAQRDTTSSPSFTTSDGKLLHVQCLPSFAGGQEALDELLRKKIKRPSGPRQRGTVQVSFVVLTTGGVSNVHIKPGNGLAPAYDAALISAINSLPAAFQPGGCNGNARAMEITIPYTFR